MEIRRIEAPQAPLRRMNPEEVLADRNPVYVHLDAEITLQIEGRALVTYGPGTVAAPASIANVLVEHGGEIVGSSLPRAADKPAPSKWPTPTKGGLSGSIRFKI